jgi:microcystin degradation protein MlrC
MVAAATELGYEPVGLLFAGTAPSGTIADECYIALRDEIVSRLKEAMPVDVVAVDNHGAGVAESFECIEGDLVSKLREVVGPSVPIVGTFGVYARPHSHGEHRASRRSLKRLRDVLPSQTYTEIYRTSVRSSTTLVSRDV